MAEGLANTGDGRPFCSAPAVMLTLITSHPGRIGGCTLKGFFKAHVDGGVLDRPAGGLQRTRDLSVRSEVQGRRAALGCREGWKEGGPAEYGSPWGWGPRQQGRGAL